MRLSKRSRRGVFWLLVISGIVTVLPRMIVTWSEAQYEEPAISHEAFAAVSAEILETEESRNQQWQHGNTRKFVAPPQRFDPNAYLLEDWMKLGLTAKQADVVIRFAQRGLYSNDDLQRIFVIPEELYALIKDSTYYPERKSNAFTNHTAAREKIWIDINTADKEELMKIPGIGAYFADKIVFYRSKLGGYVATEQLLEIRKFDAQKLQDIEAYIYLNPGSLVKLNVNTADFETLNAHPYISSEVANSIVKMRAQKAFVQVEDVRRSKLIDDALFEKIYPYLTLQ
jgi:DNA uptake protein ComE-like DNA-binding protein